MAPMIGENPDKDTPNWKKIPQMGTGSMSKMIKDHEIKVGRCRLTLSNPR